MTQEIIEFYEGNRELSFYNYDKYRLKNINHSIEQYQQYQQNLFKLKLKVNLCSEFIIGSLFSYLFGYKYLFGEYTRF